MTQGAPRRIVARLGRGLLLIGLPLAFLAAINSPNEYQATLGLDALDCDGPLQTYLLAAPVLVLYSAGLVLNVRHWRKRANLIAAILCLGICAVVTANVLAAVTEEHRQAEACAALN